MTPTPWGYDVDLTDHDGEMPPFITLAEFHELTKHAFSQDERIERTIAGVSARIRNHCGWHVWPSLPCEVTLDGGTRTVWLPANHVTALTSVEVGGVAVAATEYQWSRLGQLRLPPTPDVLSALVIEYMSGHSGDCPYDLAALVAHRVVHAVAMPFGVQQETVGSVSRSYVTSMAVEAGGVNLSARDRDALAPYKLVEAM